MQIMSWMQASQTEKIDRIIQIFRYLQDKDIFEGFYKNSFSKRLLDQRRVLEDAEKEVIKKLIAHRAEEAQKSRLITMAKKKFLLQAALPTVQSKPELVKTADALMQIQK